MERRLTHVVDSAVLGKLFTLQVEVVDLAPHLVLALAIEPAAGGCQLSTKQGRSKQGTHFSTLASSTSSASTNLSSAG